MKSLGKITLLLFYFLSTPLQAEPGDEDDRPTTTTPFAIPGLAQHIFSYLPDKDLKSARAVSQEWKNNSEASLDAFFQKNGFLVIPPWLISTLPDQAVSVSLSLEDLLSHEKLAASCYRALFQEELPEEKSRRNKALRHLLIVFSARGIYVRKDDAVKETKGVFERIGSQLEEKLTSLAKVSPHVIFKHDISEERLGIMRQKPHTIVSTSTAPDYFYFSKYTLAKLLATNPEHRVLLSVKNQDYCPWGSFRFSSSDVPENLRHFMMINPAKDILITDYSFLFCCTNLTTLSLSLPATIINGYFLSRCKKLRTVNLHLPEVVSVGFDFLYHCEELTTLELHLPKVTTIESDFLSFCKKLRTLNLYLPEVVSIGFKFLCHCEELTTLDLYLPEVTTIESGFMAYCNKLRTLNLYLPKVTSIEHSFLKGCYSLPKSKKEEVRDLLRSRGIEWN